MSSRRRRGSTKKKHRQPSDEEVRAKIDAIGDTLHIADIKHLPKNSDDEQYLNTFRYQYLIAGRISEVCGQYAPLGIDAFEVEIGGIPAVLFAVQTAKRTKRTKEGGLRAKLRACALPLDPKYEPWAKPLLDYFKVAGDNYPFMFADKPETSKRYVMWAAKEVFKGLEYPMIEYTKSRPHKIKKKQILDRTVDDKNREKWLLELEGKKKKWYTVMDRDNLIVNWPVEVLSRWKPFTSHALRKRRTFTLKTKYRFDAFDLAAYGGWTEKSQVDAMPGALKHYLYVRIDEAEDSIGLLIDMASIYFPKLFRPIKSIR